MSNIQNKIILCFLYKRTITASPNWLILKAYSNYSFDHFNIGACITKIYIMFYISVIINCKFYIKFLVLLVCISWSNFVPSCWLCMDRIKTYIHTVAVITSLFMSTASICKKSEEDCLTPSNSSIGRDISSPGQPVICN